MPRFIPCQTCGTEGRIIRRTTGYEPGCGHAHSWGERDCGECPDCHGRGEFEVEDEPIEMIDLDAALEADGEKLRQPFAFNE